MRELGGGLNVERHFRKFRGQPIGDYGIDAIIETRNDKYWLNHPLSVIIVLSSPVIGELIWECVNKQTEKMCQEGWEIGI